MSKQSGLGDGCLVDGVDLSGDVGSLGAIGGGPAVLPKTGINKSGHERMGGIRDGRIEWSSWFNPSAGAAHDTLSTLPLTNRIVTYQRGTLLGSPAACLVGKQIDYAPNRGDDGALTIALSALANGYGLDWGEQATPGTRTDTAATNGASLDGGAASSFGLQAWLHVTALTGDDVTVSLEQSSDDGGTDAYAAVTGGAFTEVTAAPASERIQTARGQAVERYLRVVTAGTFTSVSFVVVVCRNPVSVVF